MANRQVDRSKDQLFFASEASLSYLDGSLPGDFGFDPLGLVRSKQTNKTPRCLTRSTPHALLVCSPLGLAPPPPLRAAAPAAARAHVALTSPRPHSLTHNNI